jgi:hypothetical protein
MLERARIEPSAAALIMAVTVAQNRAAALRLRDEAQDTRERATALARRADSLETAAAEAERKLQELIDSTMMGASESSSTAQPFEPYAISPRETALAENCGITLVYDRLRRGEYTAVKDGNRTKILVESIKRRRATHLLPHAEHKSLTPTRWRRSKSTEIDIPK